jgi:hypothetical protein
MALPVSLVRHSLLLMLLAVLPLCATHPSPASHSPREFQFQKALHSRPSLSLSFFLPIFYFITPGLTAISFHLCARPVQFVKKYWIF